MKKFNQMLGFFVLCAFLNVGCSESSSGGSSYSGPSGLSSEQQDKYNKLSPEGKKYVDEKMRAYDQSK